jgi:hypothetical protein
MKTATVLLLATAASAQEAPFSGPQSGEALRPFQVLMVNTGDAGREIDFVGRHQGAPTLVVFLHQLDRNVAALMQPIEKYSQDRAQAGLRTLWVYLAADKVEGERRMQAVTRSLKLQSPAGVSVDGVEGPGSYGLNKSVAVTALVANQGNVTANFAIVQPGMVDSPRILNEAAKHVGGKVMTLAELEAEREKSRGAVGAMRTTAAEPDPPEMVTLLRQLIQKTNDQARVDETVKSLRQWAGTDPKRRSQLSNKLGVIIPLQYGTGYAQSQMPLLKAELEK